MQLLYVWCNSYKNIKDQDFNFGGSPYFFKYNNKTNELTINENKAFISNFFSTLNEDNINVNNISNITAIIGANGSGKTMFLEMLIDNSHVNRIEIIAYKNNDNYYLSCTYKKNIIKIIGNKKEDFKDSNMQFDEILNEFSCIYFSNIAVGTFSKSTYSNIFDISFKTLLEEQITFAIEEQKHARKNQDIVTKPFNTFEREEIKSQIKFITFNTKKEFISKELLSFLPNILEISYKSSNTSYREGEDDMPFKNEYLNSFLSKNQQDYLAKRNWLTTTILEELAEDVKKSKNKGLNHFAFHIFISCIKDFNIYYQEEIEKYFKNIYDKNDIVNSIKKLCAIFKLPTYKSIIEHFKYIEDYYALNKEETYVIQIANKEIEEDSFFLFLDNYTKTKLSYLSISWKRKNGGIEIAKISSGEAALLSLFSRLYDVEARAFSEKNKATRVPIKNRKLKPNIFILIDEGDLYLHPLWEKKFIKMLVDFLPYCFNSEKIYNIQIVLTSHSPFIISDLPKDNIIFLKKSENCDCSCIESVEGIKKEQTFGANIHTLLADSFFMENGLIGEFAKAKIQSVLDWLNKIDINEEKMIAESKQMLDIINLIGEPIVKMKLLEMYDKKVNDKAEARFIDKQIELLQKRRRNLKNN